MLLRSHHIIRLACIFSLSSSFVYAENSVNVASSTQSQAVAVAEITQGENADEMTVASPILSVNQWGLAIGMRRADIPFAVSEVSDDTAVYDILPLIRFENDYGFINGLEGGVHLWKNADHQVNVYSRFRFNDIPKEFQNQIKGQSFDFGLQYRYSDGPWEADIAVLSDNY